MAYYYHPGANYGETWDIPPQAGRREDTDSLGPQPFIRPSSESPIRNNSPTRGQQQEENNQEMGGGRQRYTYIPSTSSISPGAGIRPLNDVQLPESTPWPLYPPGHQPFIPPGPPGQTPYPSWAPSPFIPPIPGPIIPGESSPVMYASVDPFRRHGKEAPKTAKPSLPVAHDDLEAYVPDKTVEYVVYPYAQRRTVLLALLVDFLNLSFRFFFDSLPRQIYLIFLLYLPSFYFSRVARIFDEAEMTMPEIETMAFQAMGSITIQELQWSSPASANLKTTWESFIDSLLREWKTLNIVSVLLLSAILTILQIEGASSDPVARNCALISLVCATMSLLYGCLYIIRFSSMRKTYKALEWAKMAQKTTTVIWWNVWVLLALPATWLAWSIILYIACIMAFVWRTGTNGLESQLNLSAHAQLAIRIAISAVLGLGVLYFTLIINTLRRYGDTMDKQFKKELDVMVRTRRQGRQYGHGSSYPYMSSHMNAGGVYPMSSYQTPRWFRRAKVIDFRFQSRLGKPMPDHLSDRGFTNEKWEKFISDAYSAWNGVHSGPFNIRDSGPTPPRPQDSVAQLLEKWNQKYFQPRSALAILCHEYIDLFPDSPVFAIYVVDVTPLDNQPTLLAERFGPVPDGLSRIDIFDQPDGHKRSTRRILGRTSIFSTRNPLDGRVRFPDRKEDIRSPIVPPTGWGPPSRTPSPESTPNPSSSPSLVRARSRNGTIDESGRNHLPQPPGEIRRRSASYSPRRESPARDTTIHDRRRPSAPPTGSTSVNAPSYQPLYVPPASYPRPPSMYPGTPFIPPLPVHIPTIPPLQPQPNHYTRRPIGFGQTPPITTHLRPASRASDSRRRRSITSFTHPEAREGPVSRFIPLPPASPDYQWSAQMDMAPTPNTYHATTPSAISQLDIVMPPFMQPQYQPAWTPYQYQYQQPPMSRSPWLSYEPRLQLAEMLRDTAVQPRHRDTGRPRERSRESPDTQSHSNIGPAPAEPPRDPVESLSHNVNARRRSTSTSYRSFSRSPARDNRPPSPGNPSGSPINAIHIHGISSVSPLLDGGMDVRQQDDTSSNLPPNRGRDRTPRARAQLVNQPGSLLSGSDIIIGPWTTDHSSLRKIFDTQ